MSSAEDLEEDVLTMELTDKLGTMHADLLPPISASRTSLASAADELDKVLRKWTESLKREECKKLSVLIKGVLKESGPLTTKGLVKKLKSNDVECTKKAVNACLYEYEKVFVRSQSASEAPTWSVS